MRVTGHALGVYRFASRVALWTSNFNMLATPLRTWLDQFEVIWLAPRDWSLWDFRRPDYDSCLVWHLYAGWWLIRRYKR